MSDKPQWHHHHNHERRIVFCYVGNGDDECMEEYDGLVCDGNYNGPCRWSLAWDIATPAPQQPLLWGHLEEVRDWQTKSAAIGEDSDG